MPCSYSNKNLERAVWIKKSEPSGTNGKLWRQYFKSYVEVAEGVCLVRKVPT